MAINESRDGEAVYGLAAMTAIALARAPQLRCRRRAESPS